MKKSIVDGPELMQASLTDRIKLPFQVKSFLVLLSKEHDSNLHFSYNNAYYMNLKNLVCIYVVWSYLNFDWSNFACTFYWKGTSYIIEDCITKLLPAYIYIYIYIYI